MKSNLRPFGLVLSVVTLLGSAAANAELVLESAPRDEVREETRSVLEASEKRKTVLAEDSAETAPVEASKTSDVSSASRSELLRRERVRAELRNEDMLQERLEELRLRDEQKRTQNLLGIETQALAPNAIVSPTVVTQEVSTVKPPVTAPVSSPSSDETKSVEKSEKLASIENQSEAKEVTSSKSKISVQPRGGLNGIWGNSAYIVNPKFAAGAGAAYSVGEHISFEGGYTYSEMGVAANISNPYINAYRAWSMYSPQIQNLETVTLRQHIIDLGVKVHVLGTDSRIRPFAGVGGGYGKSLVNYNQNILAALSQSQIVSLRRDYDVNQFLGYLSAGMDIRITSSISAGVTAKYYNVFSAQESGQQPYWGWADLDKQAIGSSLAITNFVSLMAGLTFTF